MSANNSEKEKQFWVIIPAAGVGKRMQADRPKQYLPLYNKTVIEHTLDRLLALDDVVGAVLSVSETDEYWPELNYRCDKPLYIAKGGKERSDSVLNALELLDETVGGSEAVWVLVHDAARPCVRADDVKNLIRCASETNDGGLLALPVRDTMKRSNDTSQIVKTVIREGLWHALTPQMFPLACLKPALINAQKNKLVVTDDASAMELAGYSPLLIEAHEDNIKITRAFDLKLAEMFMQNQAQ